MELMIRILWQLIEIAPRIRETWKERAKQKAKDREE